MERTYPIGNSKWGPIIANNVTFNVMNEYGMGNENNAEIIAKITQNSFPISYNSDTETSIKVLYDKPSYDIIKPSLKIYREEKKNVEETLKTGCTTKRKTNRSSNRKEPKNTVKKIPTRSDTKIPFNVNRYQGKYKELNLGKAKKKESSKDEYKDEHKERMKKVKSDAIKIRLENAFNTKFGKKREYIDPRVKYKEEVKKKEKEAKEQHKKKREQMLRGRKKVLGLEFINTKSSDISIKSEVKKESSNKKDEISEELKAKRKQLVKDQYDRIVTEKRRKKETKERLENERARKLKELYEYTKLSVTYEKPKKVNEKPQNAIKLNNWIRGLIEESGRVIINKSVTGKVYEDTPRKSLADIQREAASKKAAELRKKICSKERKVVEDSIKPLLQIEQRNESIEYKRTPLTLPKKERVNSTLNNNKHVEHIEEIMVKPEDNLIEYPYIQTQEEQISNIEETKVIEFNKKPIKSKKEGVKGEDAMMKKMEVRKSKDRRSPRTLTRDLPGVTGLAKHYKKERLMDKRDIAATQIQKHVRGYITRQGVKKLHEQYQIIDNQLNKLYDEKNMFDFDDELLMEKDPYNVVNLFIERNVKRLKEKFGLEDKSQPEVLKDKEHVQENTKANIEEDLQRDTKEEVKNNLREDVKDDQQEKVNIKEDELNEKDNIKTKLQADLIVEKHESDIQEKSVKSEPVDRFLEAVKGMQTQHREGIPEIVNHLYTHLDNLNKTQTEHKADIRYPSEIVSEIEPSVIDKKDKSIDEEIINREIEQDPEYKKEVEKIRSRLPEKAEDERRIELIKKRILTERILEEKRRAIEEGVKDQILKQEEEEVNKLYQDALQYDIKAEIENRTALTLDLIKSKANEITDEEITYENIDESDIDARKALKYSDSISEEIKGGEGKGYLKTSSYGYSMKFEKDSQVESIIVNNKLPAKIVPTEPQSKLYASSEDSEAVTGSDIDWVLSLEQSFDTNKQPHETKTEVDQEYPDDFEEEISINQETPKSIKGRTDKPESPYAPVKPNKQPQDATQLTNELINKAIPKIMKELIEESKEELNVNILNEKTDKIVDEIMIELLEEIKTSLFPIRYHRKGTSAPPKRHVTGICTTLPYVEKYIDEVFDSILKDPETFIQVISQPLTKDSLYSLRRIQDEDIDVLFDTIPDTIQLVLPVEKYLHIERSRKLDDILEHPESPQHEAFLTELFNIHHKCIFDAINYALDFYRPYGIRGPPSTWSKQTRVLTFRNGSVESIKDILKEVKAKVMSWASHNAGALTLLEHNENTENKLKLEQMREERLESMLSIEVNEEKLDWIDYEKEETQTILDLADIILEEFVSEAVTIMNLSTY